MNREARVDCALAELYIRSVHTETVLREQKHAEVLTKLYTRMNEVSSIACHRCIFLGRSCWRKIQSFRVTVTLHMWLVVMQPFTWCCEVLIDILFLCHKAMTCHMSLLCRLVHVTATAAIISVNRVLTWSTVLGSLAPTWLRCSGPSSRMFT